MLLFISNGNIFLHILFFCCLSFFGQFLVIKLFANQKKAFAIPIYLSFLLLPSISFWGAGMLKESLLFLGIGLLLYAFSMKKIVLKLLFLFSGFLILLYVKPILLVLLLLCLVVFYVFTRIKNTKFLLRLSVIVLLIAFFFKVPQTAMRIGIEKRNQFVVLSAKTNAKSVIDTTVYSPNFSNGMKLIPSAFVAGAARPFIWQAYKKPFDLFFSLEAILFVSLLVFCLFHLSFYQFLKENKALCCSLIFGGGYLFLLGLTIPVLGALVRYKVIALPFVLFPLLAFIFSKYYDILYKYIYDKNIHICEKK